MKPMATLTCLLTIMAAAIDAVRATPIGPDLSRLRLSKTKYNNGDYRRKAGEFKDPAMFNTIFLQTNEMIDCLVHNALPNYHDTANPFYKTLLDKYYYIHNNEAIFNSVRDLLHSLTTLQLRIYGDEFAATYGPNVPAFTSSQRISATGEHAWGIFFTVDFSNKGTAQPRSMMARAMILLHESIHLALPLGHHGDHVRVNGPGNCEFLAANQYKSLKKQAKDTHNPDLMRNVFALFWKGESRAGWEAVQANCPEILIGVPDATMGAGYECLKGHEPDLRGSLYWN